MCETPGLRFLLITYVPKLERLDGMAVSDAERRGRQRGAAPPPVAAIMPPEAHGTQLTASAGAAARSQPARDGSPDAPTRLGGEADDGAGVGGRTRGGTPADGGDAHWHAGALTTLATQGRRGKAAGPALALAAPPSDDELVSDDGDGNEMPEWVRDAMADESGAAGAGGRRGSAAARPPYAASKPPAATAAETAKERAAISQGKGAAPSRRAKGWNDTDAEEDEEDDEDEGARRRGRATTRVPARGSAEEAAAVERMAEESRAEQAHMRMHVHVHVHVRHACAPHTCATGAAPRPATSQDWARAACTYAHAHACACALDRRASSRGGGARRRLGRRWRRRSERR